MRPPSGQRGGASRDTSPSSQDVMPLSRPERRWVAPEKQTAAGATWLDLNAGTSSLGGGKKSNNKKGLDLRNTPPTVLHALDTPTICALNGSAAGYGMDLAMGCDIRVMSSEAKLAAAFTARSYAVSSSTMIRS